MSLLLVLLIAPGALGHIKPIVGRLVDLVRQSSLVVIGVVTRSPDAGPEAVDVAIGSILRGWSAESSLRLRCGAALPLGDRQVVFIARDGDGLRCVQPRGSQFPVVPGSEGDYERTVRAIARALQLPEARQTGALREALIPALRAGAVELRYHAALDLGATVHADHELTTSEREAIAAVRAAPDVDPVLVPILDRLLR